MFFSLRRSVSLQIDKVVTVDAHGKFIEGLQNKTDFHNFQKHENHHAYLFNYDIALWLIVVRLANQLGHLQRLQLMNADESNASIRH